MQTYTVTQTRQVQVEAKSKEGAARLANKAFYGNRPAKGDPTGKVVSAVQINDLHTKESNE